MTEIKEPAQEDNEKLIENLKEEIAHLKSEIYQLEKENSILKRGKSNLEMRYATSKELEINEFTQKEDNKALKFFKKLRKMETTGSVEGSNINETKPNFEIPVELELSVPTLSSSNKPIEEGYSRRECPICGNNRHMFIYEEADKSNIVMDYPRIYGKKYKCGKCGAYWKLKSPTLE